MGLYSWYRIKKGDAFEHSCFEYLIWGSIAVLLLISVTFSINRIFFYENFKFHIIINNILYFFILFVLVYMLFRDTSFLNQSFFKKLIYTSLLSAFFLLLTQFNFPFLEIPALFSNEITVCANVESVSKSYRFDISRYKQYNYSIQVDGKKYRIDRDLASDIKEGQYITFQSVEGTNKIIEGLIRVGECYR
jgi:hypothetical protein